MTYIETRCATRSARGCARGSAGTAPSKKNVTGNVTSQVNGQKNSHSLAEEFLVCMAMLGGIPILVSLHMWATYLLG